MNPIRWARSEILHFAWQRGLYQPPDRRMLEEDILPSLARSPDVSRVLFVGVKWYNAHHKGLFDGKTFATIDPDPEQARYGGAPHAVDFVQNLEKHFDGLVFDAIIMSGVVGWGINDVEELDRTLQAFSRVMRPGAWLIFGLNPLTKNHVEPSDAPTSGDFEPAAFGRFAKARVDVPLPFKQRLHTFLFWKKRSNEAIEGAR